MSTREATLSADQRREILNTFFIRASEEYFWNRDDVQEWTVEDLANLITDEMRRKDGPRKTVVKLLHRRFTGKRKLIELGGLAMEDTQWRV